MPFYKNTASQKIFIYAWDRINDRGKIGHAANITAQISKDGGPAAATNDTNPTELDAADHPGVYCFDTIQSETDADVIILSAVSSTDDVWIDPVIIHTHDATLFSTAGAIEYTYTIDDGSNPIEGVEVWISTDSEGGNIIWTGTTDASGVARATDGQKPWLDAGTYYGWAQKGGYTFSNPDTLTVS